MRWERIKNRPGEDVPSARYSHSFVCYHKIRKSDSHEGNKEESETVWDNEAILFGGMSVTGKRGDTWAFNLVTQSWRQLALVGEYPTPRYGHTAVIYDHCRMLVFGGFDGCHLNDVHILDLERGVWKRETTTGKVPPPLFLHSSVLFEEKKMLVFGGNAQVLSKDTFILDIDSMHWKKLKTVGCSPPSISDHSVAVYGRKMVIFGGWGGDTTNGFYILDLDNNEWTRLNKTSGHSTLEDNASPNNLQSVDIPRPRFGHVSTIFANKLLVFGGSSHGTYYNDVAQYDLETSNWQVASVTGQYPEPRAHHAATTVFNNCWLIFGGRGQDSRVLDSTYLLHTGLVSENYHNDLLEMLKEGCFSDAPLTLNCSRELDLS